jgi:hypothetical protein
MAEFCADCTVVSMGADNLSLDASVLRSSVEDLSSFCGSVYVSNPFSKVPLSVGSGLDALNFDKSLVLVLGMMSTTEADKHSTCV